MEQQNTLDIVDPKYQQTLIYGIQCMTTGEMYVGSTHQTLEERIRKHILLRNCRAVQILDRGNYKAYEIQRWPCNTLREVLTLEGGWQRAYKASFPDHFVNKKIEGTFQNDSPEAKKAYDKIYCQTHSEIRRARNKLYRENNKEYCSLRRKQWYADNREKNVAYSIEYNKAHRKERRAYDKVYKNQNRELISAQRKQPWTCNGCKTTMNKSSQSRHKKTCKFKPNVHEAQKGC